MPIKKLSLIEKKKKISSKNYFRNIFTTPKARADLIQALA
tara:strand:- start:107 stop:226 length:120 start_codon:yes stop_codon:yes gene_type:complete